MEPSQGIETIFVGAWPWVPAAVTLAVCISLAAIWSYAANRQLSSLRWLTTCLKLAAVASLAFCLVEPLQRVERPRPRANVVAVVVDDSRSMQIKPSGSQRSRAERLRARLAFDEDWQSRIAQDFDLRKYAFGSRLRAVERLEELRFDSNFSSLATAVGTIGERFANRPVAGVLLFTDGLATDQTESLLVNQMDFPIYPVLPADDQSSVDISVGDTSVSLSSFELAPAVVEATIRATGIQNETISVRLLSQSGTTLEQETLSVDSPNFESKVRFQFKPETTGFQFVRLQAISTSEDVDDPTVPLKSRREVTIENNTRLLAVDRGGGPYRILYVAGRPNWDYKFMRRALTDDIEVELHGLLRLAKKEPKFSFRDQSVESTNPLLAGFSDDEETTEQYDEPVLVRMGVSGDELQAGFPSGEEDLYYYHAIVLDDIEAEFFTQQQMLLMRKFVAERGGGLMMLGGQESFMGSSYDKTPLGDVLPVYLRGAEDERFKQQTVRYELTREGALEPWLRLRSNLADEQTRTQQMPDFLTWNAVSGTKPGASTLASLQTASGDAPAFVTQRFGQGRSAALLIGDFWRWSMRRPADTEDDLSQAWRQIARWLTSDVPRRIDVRVETPVDPTEPFQVAVQLRDTSFKPLDNAQVVLEVTEPNGNTVTTTAAPDAEQAGLYQSEYWARDAGAYRCRVLVTTPDGQELTEVKTGWVGEPNRSEFERVTPDREFLQQIATASGGEVIDMEDLDQFVATLPTRRVPVTEAQIEPLWHRPWFVLFAICCLCLEWGIRRWKGLP